jgi:sigma-B regulation protein RsbU (phosphoserine phosphatase)
MTAENMVLDVSHDWMLACHVQQRFMRGPAGNASALDYGGQCRQVRALGGDCYDFMSLTDDRTALVVGDASGKGLAAALMMASVQSSLRTAALFTSDDLPELMRIVNVQAYHSSAADRFTTLFFGLFDKAAQTLRYVNAGHNPPVVLREDGSVRWLEPGGAAIGMFPDSDYEEGAVRLKPGDLVIAYTDGVVEAENAEGEEWGVQGLLRAAGAWAPRGRGSAQDLVQWIFDSMDEFSPCGQMDDATVAVLRVV